MPAHLERSHWLSHDCSLLSRRPVGADRIPQRDRQGAPAHFERSQGLCEFCSVLSLRLTILSLHQVGADGVSVCVGRRAAHREGIARISGPPLQTEDSCECATCDRKLFIVESSGLSCSLLWTVSVDSSFTVCLGRPFFVVITQRGFVILRPTRTIIETKRRFPYNLGGVGGAGWS